jgi:hypothetical protein
VGNFLFDWLLCVAFYCALLDDWLADMLDTLCGLQTGCCTWLSAVRGWLFCVAG